MLPFPFLLIAFCLLAGPAWGNEPSTPGAVTVTNRAAGALPVTGDHLSLFRTRQKSPRLLLDFAEEHPEVTAKKELPLQLRSEGDLVKLVFSRPSLFTPWLGAGFDLESGSEFPASYRLGAGFGCPLGDLTQLHLGYRFSNPWLESGEIATVSDVERHQFTVALETCF